MHRPKVEELRLYWKLALVFGLFWFCDSGVKGQSRLNHAGDLPKKFAFSGGSLQFKAISDKKVEKLLANEGSHSLQYFEQGVLPEAYTRVEIDGQPGFRLSFGNGMGRQFQSLGLPDSEGADSLEDWTFVSYDRSHGLVLLSAAGPERQGLCIVQLSDGHLEWVAAEPHINAKGTWIVAATDYTESDLRPSILEIYHRGAGSMEIVFALEARYVGYEFKGWGDSRTGVLRFWYYDLDDRRVGEWYRILVRGGLGRR